MSDHCTCHMPPWVKNPMYHDAACPIANTGSTARLTHPQSSDVEAIAQEMWASEDESGTLDDSGRRGTFERLAHAALRALPHPVASSTGEREQIARVIALHEQPKRDFRLNPLSRDEYRIWSLADAILAHRPTDAARCAVLEEALTPSADTKAAYIGEFSFTIIEQDEDGDERPRRVLVPWTTTKEIMAAIMARAALAQEQPSPTDATPAGYVLVPREPTWEMTNEGEHVLTGDPNGLDWLGDRDHAKRIWSAMLAAIPTDATRPSDAGEVERLREALEDAASTFDSLYHYTFDHGLSQGGLAGIVRRDADAASIAARAALSSLPTDGGQS